MNFLYRFLLGYGQQLDRASLHFSVMRKVASEFEVRGCEQPVCFFEV